MKRLEMHTRTSLLIFTALLVVTISCSLSTPSNADQPMAGTAFDERVGIGNVVILVWAGCH